MGAVMTEFQGALEAVAAAEKRAAGLERENRDLAQGLERARARVRVLEAEVRSMVAQRLRDRMRAPELVGRDVAASQPEHSSPYERAPMRDRHSDSVVPGSGSY